MGYHTYCKRHRSSLALTVLLIALSLMSNHRIHVVARHLTETSLSKDYPEVPDTEVPDNTEVPDDPDDPVDEIPAPVVPENPFLPQPNFPEVPGDLPELMPPPPELPSSTISTQAMAAKP